MVGVSPTGTLSLLKLFNNAKLGGVCLNLKPLMVTIPVFDQDLFADEFIQNPYPAYARMRELGPVVWLPVHGNFALTQHREVRAALRDNETFISGDGVAADEFGCNFLQGNTVASDGQKHAELRQAMAAPILPGELGSIKPGVQAAADQLIDDLLTRGKFDAIADLAQHLPLTIVRDLVGLPDFGQDKMLQWAAAAFDVLGVQNGRGQQALATIADMRQFIQKDATRENLKPGSWTRRIHELVDAGQLPCEHAPFAIRDYINPSLDTTISAIGEMLWQLANNPDQWEELKQQPRLVRNAVNEAIRLATPIRSFSRHTSKDTNIAGVAIKRGSRVMMLFASANRDERVFPNPDQFDVTRNPTDHLGFGSGVHMCVGMHLAQLEMEALLHAMLMRVGKIKAGAPTVKLNNTIRAFATLPCQFEAEESARVTARATPVEHSVKQTASLLSGVVKCRSEIAENIISLIIEPATSERFPVAEAGAHIDVHLPTGTRQYSLTGDLESHKDQCFFQIAVLKTNDSRGGSEWLHAHAHPGRAISLSRPRNRFPLISQEGKVYLIAGGVGLTPLLAMAWQLYRARREFELHVYARSADHLPFAPQLNQGPLSAHVQIHLHNNESAKPPGSIDSLGIKALVAGTDNGDSASVYVCGPAGFMQEVEQQALAGGIAKDNIYSELFGAEIDPNGEPFTLIARKSGLTLQVLADKTILATLREAGIAAETSCENGVCGSCLTHVLEGLPDHRDMVQTLAEKSTNEQIAVCCSRSLSARLVLDI